VKRDSAILRLKNDYHQLDKAYPDSYNLLFRTHLTNYRGRGRERGRGRGRRRRGRRRETNSNEDPDLKNHPVQEGTLNITNNNDHQQQKSQWKKSTCVLCGEEGHFMRNCPHFAAAKGNPKKSGKSSKTFHVHAQEPMINALTSECETFVSYESCEPRADDPNASNTSSAIGTYLIA
jgi:hypothetical protein